jgi:hypothetical protein
MDSPHSPQDRSKQSASREERQELATVVDGKFVPDDDPLAVAKTVDAPPMSTLDKIVMAVVVVGIILFASFQISQCVVAYNNPATQSSVDNVTRTFPGIMLCPFSYDAYGYSRSWFLSKVVSRGFSFIRFHNLISWMPTLFICYFIQHQYLPCRSKSAIEFLPFEPN